MKEPKFRVLRDQACESWKRVEQHRLAYSAGSKANQKRSNLLNLSTVGLGACTGLSGVLSLVPAIGSATIATALIGMGTAIAVGVKQTFKWEEKAKELWSCSVELENLLRELQRYIYNVALNGDQSVDLVYIQKLDDKLKTIASTRVDNVDNYKSVAEANLKELNISTLSIARVQRQAVAKATVPAAPPNAQMKVDAAGIEQMVRGEARGLPSQQ